MKKIVPNIAVKNCQQALEYYQDVFGGEIANVQLADGKEMFKGYEGQIVHAELRINPDCIIFFNDVFGEQREDSKISLLLEMVSEEEINKLYATLSQKGKVVFALQKTFWGSYHAVVTDCFGTTWSLDYSV